jgi:hypothetical protein
MGSRSLTNAEKKALLPSLRSWLGESERLARDVENLLHSNASSGPNWIAQLAWKMTYFILASGCVYLHCQSLLEAKLGTRNRANAWLRRRRANCPSLQTLRNRRDWLNHGAIYRCRNFNLVLDVFKGPDKGFGKALAEARRNKSSAIREIVTAQWTDGYGRPVENVLRWQESLLSDMRRMVEDINTLNRPST